MSPPTMRRRRASSSWRPRRTLTSGLKKPLIGGLPGQCQVLDILSPRVTPSSTGDHVEGAVSPRNHDPISLPSPTNHVPRPPGQHSQPVMRRRATRHGLLITVPLARTTVQVSPCHLVTRMFSRGEVGLEPFPHFSLLPRPPITGLGRGQKVVARRALHTTPHRSTSPPKKAMMKRSSASKPLNLKDLSRKPSERIALGYFQLVPVLGLP